MYSFKCNFSIMIFFSYYATLTRSKEANITIPLNKIIIEENRELYGDFIYLNRSSSLRVNFEKVNENISFIIFQVHSHLYNVTVYQNVNKKNVTFYGTNVGFHSSKPSADVFFVVNNNVDLKLYISVHGYRYTDPIPGGCIETAADICPYVQTQHNKDYIYVDVAPPQLYNDQDCVQSLGVSIQFYMMYLPDKHYDSNIYFETIRNMMTWDKIKQNGKIVAITYRSMTWRVRRIVSAYPGTGAIYVAVARVGNNRSYYSVYVPTSTYACAPLQEDGCELLHGALSQLMCALLFFIGLFLCYAGHRFFKTQTFLVGGFAGFTITYIVMCLIADLDQPALLSVSVLSGLCFGGFPLMCWWLFGIPLITVFLTTLNFGFLFSSLLYYIAPTYRFDLDDDSVFWFLFMMVMLLTATFLLLINRAANMLCCAVIGSYAIVYSMDYYLESNLKYIIINTVRRAVVDTFNLALLLPPFLWRDKFLTAIWVILAYTGFLFQYYHNKGKPPFPPPPRSVRAVPEFPSSIIGTGRYDGNEPASNERTPLLG